MKNLKIVLAVALVCVASVALTAQQLSPADKKYSEIANYDESKVPEYILPDVLTTINGEKITTAKEWEAKRRPEVVSMFETYVYGKAPARSKNVRYEVVSVQTDALGGKATRKMVKVYFTDKDTLHLNLQIYLPNQVKGAKPLFLGLSFGPNQSVVNDPDVQIPAPAAGAPVSRFGAKGGLASAWQLDMLLENGYGLATIYCADMDPDFDDGFKNGVHGLFNNGGKKMHMPDEWGSLAAWAWGLSRAMDYIEKDKDIDSKHVGVVGHSRLGKAAVWAGAIDTRFALVISGNSGCGGAAISRRKYGETIEAITVRFPHWWAGNLWQFNGREEKMPFDQHELISLIAPRPVYIASASEDNWSDQKGEFLGGKGAEPVYALYGLAGIGTETMPSIDVPYAQGYIAYHNRTGRHAITEYDWVQFIKFANLRFFNKTDFLPLK